MCFVHWRLVPLELRRRIWKYYRPGQCDDMNPSKEYVQAAKAARDAVSFFERSKAGKIQHEPRE